MVYPSKQGFLLKILRKELAETYSPGDKLPPERVFSAHLGVTRKTLRSALAVLEAEHLISRSRKGTIVLARKYPAEKDLSLKGEEGPVLYVLLPCPDFMFACGNPILHKDLISGVMHASVRAGASAVTIPVSENNDPENINFPQLSVLPEGAKVIFAGGEWFAPVIPFLLRKKCRLAFISQNDIFKGMEPEYGYFNLRTNGITSWTEEAVEELAEKGCRNIGFVTFQQQYVKKYFFSGLSQNSLRGELLPISRDGLTPEICTKIGEFYKKHHFDAMILDISAGDSHISFFEMTDLPKNIPYIVSIREEFLRDPYLQENGRCFYLPTFSNGVRMAEYLLSGRNDTVIEYKKHLFEDIKEYIKHNGQK